MELTIISSLAFGEFSAIFGTCELGQWLTYKSSAIFDVLCQCPWYLLPTELRRRLVIIMLSSQEEIIIHSYGNVPCSRETFKKVNIVEHSKWNRFK